MNRAIVYLDILKVDGKKSSCTGAFFGPNIIATAWHCVHDAQSVEVYGGDYAKGGDTYQVAQIHLPQPAQWGHPNVPLPDFALLETIDQFGGPPIPVATTLPTPFNLGGFVDALVTVAGYGDNGVNNKQRLAGTMVMDGTGTVSVGGRSVFGLEAIAGQTMVCGDSGGPVVKDGALVGVLAA